MKKRVLSLLLVLLMVVSLVPMSALADKSGNEIKQQISSTYATARSQNGGSFNGWCGAYVNYQLKILGINSYLESGGNGRDQFDYYKNKSKSNMQNQNSSLPIKYEFDVANVMKSFLNPNK